MKRPGPLPAARPSRSRIVESDRPLRPREETDNVIPLERDDDPAERPTAEPGGGGDRLPGVGWRDLWRASAARRKALRAEIRRFTARTRRRRWYALGGAAAVVLLIGGSVGAAYSPLFAVQDVRVVGAETLDAAAVQAALAAQLGTPLPLVDHDAVEEALLDFPLIETYVIEARPPHELVIRIVERTPVGVIAGDGGFTVVDAAGVALSSAPEQPAGLPLITVEGGPSSRPFAAVGQVLRSLPQSLRDQVSAASAASAQDVRLTLGATGTEVVWGTAEDSAMKALVLEKAMIAQPPQGVSVYDVSSPSAVVFR